jgi:hypothetical protein
LFVTKDEKAQTRHALELTLLLGAPFFAAND